MSQDLAIPPCLSSCTWAHRFSLSPLSRHTISTDARKDFHEGLDRRVFLKFRLLTQSCHFTTFLTVCTAVNLGANDVTTVYGKMVGCTANNTAAVVDQCQALKADNPYNDPLYNAHNWIFEMINVLPVWEMGISKCGKYLIQEKRRVKIHSHPVRLMLPLLLLCLR